MVVKSEAIYIYVEAPSPPHPSPHYVRGQSPDDKYNKKGGEIDGS